MTTDENPQTTTSPTFTTKDEALASITEAIGLSAADFNLEAVFTATHEYDDKRGLFVQVVDVDTFWQVIELCAIDTELNS